MTQPEVWCLSLLLSLLLLLLSGTDTQCCLPLPQWEIYHGHVLCFTILPLAAVVPIEKSGHGMAAWRHGIRRSVTVEFHHGRRLALPWTFFCSTARISFFSSLSWWIVLFISQLPTCSYFDGSVRFRCCVVTFRCRPHHCAVCGLSYSILPWINLNQRRLVVHGCSMLRTKIVNKCCGQKDTGIRNEQTNKVGMQIK